MEVLGIHHINIRVPREFADECLAFYRDALGLSEVPKPEALKKRGGGWFEAGDQQIHLSLEDNVSPPSKRHVCLLVDDLGKAQAHLESNGIKIEPEPIDADGLKRFFIADPAGNRIEIAQRT